MCINGGSISFVAYGMTCGLADCGLFVPVCVICGFSDCGSRHDGHGMIAGMAIGFVGLLGKVGASVLL